MGFQSYQEPRTIWLTVQKVIVHRLGTRISVFSQFGRKRRFRSLIYRSGVTKSLYLSWNYISGNFGSQWYHKNLCRKVSFRSYEEFGKIWFEKSGVLGVQAEVQISLFWICSCFATETFRFLIRNHRRFQRLFVFCDRNLPMFDKKS